MKKIKQYWKEILIGLLVIFSLNKCTTSCSRGTVVKKQNIELVKKDSTIQVLNDSLNIMKIRWNDALQSQETYQGIAIGNQQDLISQINALKIENENIKREKNSLAIEIKKKNAEIKNLKQKLGN